MTIIQRGKTDDVNVVVTCIGRFYDFFEKRDGRWGLVRRRRFMNSIVWKRPIPAQLSNSTKVW
jgi:hypothetical protein